MLMKFLKSGLYFLAFLFHHNRNSKVVYYHDVGKKYTNMGTEFDLMKRHFDIIKMSGYKIVPSIYMRKGQVMICFDDGWAGIYEYKNYFVKQGIQPTIFIAVDLIGQKGYLSVKQIKELEALGFLFECHAWSHQSLTRFSDEALKHEIYDSKKELERIFGRPFSAICYPQGRFSKHIYQLCLEYGYTRQFSSLSGGYYDLENKGLICRLCAQTSPPIVFKWMLNSTSYFFRRRLIKQHIQGHL